MGLITEHYYTCRGRQRAVFLCPEAKAAFGVELMAGDEACVEVCYDPAAVVRKGQGLWERFEGGLAGGLDGATAVRLHVGRVDGWVKMTVKREDAYGG